MKTSSNWQSKQDKKRLDFFDEKNLKKTNGTKAKKVFVQDVTPPTTAPKQKLVQRTYGPHTAPAHQTVKGYHLSPGIYGGGSVSNNGNYTYTFNMIKTQIRTLATRIKTTTIIIDYNLLFDSRHRNIWLTEPKNEKAYTAAASCDKQRVGVFELIVKDFSLADIYGAFTRVHIHIPETIESVKTEISKKFNPLGVPIGVDSHLPENIVKNDETGSWDDKSDIILISQNETFMSDIYENTLGAKRYVVSNLREPKLTKIQKPDLKFSIVKSRFD